MEKTSKIFVAGHRGMVGSAVVRALEARGFDNLALRDRAGLDLTRQEQVERFFEEERPEYVFLAAAKVGGILANSTQRADFILLNLQIQNNVISSAYRAGVRKLLFFGSTCIYPRACPQPMKEEYLLTGPLEPTNEPYAVAKIAGLKLCEAMNQQYGTNYISIMPTNLYGPGDNFDPKGSHVMAGLLRKFHQAKAEGADRVEVWGTGNARRELMHVDDCADAALFLMEGYDGSEIVNVGTGVDTSIRELAETVASIVGYRGEIFFNTEYPDGMPRKLVDVGRLSALGWRPRFTLESGIGDTYDWYLRQLELTGRATAPQNA